MEDRLDNYSTLELVTAVEEIELTLKEEIRGLELILCGSGDKDPTIHRNYVYEKLQRIRHGTMSFHPTLKLSILMERVGIEEEILELLKQNGGLNE